MVFVAKMSLKVCKFYEELIKSDPLVQTVVCRFHCSWSSSTETCDGGGLTSVAYLSKVTFWLQYLSRHCTYCLSIKKYTILDQNKKVHKTSNKARCQSTQLERNASVCGVMVFTVSLRTSLFVGAFLPASDLNELVVDKFSFLFRGICILT